MIHHIDLAVVDGKDNGAPGLRARYAENWYAAFVLDPDGHNIEAVSRMEPRKTNRTWHEKHRMPANPTAEQRIKWHIAHARHCACRPIPKGVVALMKAGSVARRTSRSSGSRTNKPKHFDKVVESGNTMSQGFCGDCGSPLYALTSGHPEFIGVRAVSLDDPSCFEAQADVWMCEAQPWVRTDALLPKLDKSPEDF